jgi:hypothetical protein
LGWRALKSRFLVFSFGFWVKGKDRSRAKTQRRKEGKAEYWKEYIGKGKDSFEFWVLSFGLKGKGGKQFWVLGVEFWVEGKRRFEDYIKIGGQLWKKINRITSL